jgi:hypothetical protein
MEIKVYRVVASPTAALQRFPALRLSRDTLSRSGTFQSEPTPSLRLADGRNSRFRDAGPERRMWCERNNASESWDSRKRVEGCLPLQADVRFQHQAVAQPDFLEHRQPRKRTYNSTELPTENIQERTYAFSETTLGKRGSPSENGRHHGCGCCSPNPNITTGVVNTELRVGR